MLLKKADLPLEAVILIIAGMAITITGIALFCGRRDSSLL